MGREMKRKRENIKMKGRLSCAYVGIANYILGSCDIKVKIFSSRRVVSGIFFFKRTRPSFAQFYNFSRPTFRLRHFFGKRGVVHRK